MAKRIVFISGIGADHRAFQRIQIPNYEAVYADWIPLKNRQESFESYCDRIAETYQIGSEDVLVGLSFGGLVAQQFAKTMGNQKVILVSSFRSKEDLQPLMYYGLIWNLYKLLPDFRIPILTDVMGHYINSRQKESKPVIQAMIQDADFRFNNWCIRQIKITDLRADYQPQFLNFTGKKDLLVKDWKGPNHVSIDNGTHFMVFDEAQSINQRIKAYLQVN
ncbi:alpha/beta fold hydrolase [Reichenbachiella ulvae]|uniref:Alpha/beta hydrolase n=1 Tax=Reichenbachiella ulvae TaxID=2980104 RepID=A0ABT3CX26_9BACT|nr:alpha/beta hydrolase [Reichenbachiella ulvae]MCV9388099.1 alpha/beta hydrolase [Reichenbachiella ulvae]